MFFAEILLLLAFIGLCAFITKKVSGWNGRYDHTAGRHRITGDTYSPPNHEHMIDVLRSPMYDRDGVTVAQCCVYGCTFTTQIGRGLPTASMQDDGSLR